MAQNPFSKYLENGLRRQAQLAVTLTLATMETTMMTTADSIPNYEIYALRYATSPDRRRSENFIVKDPHDEIMPVDYFVWLIRDGDRAWLVDTGFNEAGAKARRRQF